MLVLLALALAGACGESAGGADSGFGPRADGASECEPGAVRETSRSCGPESTGAVLEVCASGRWSGDELCRLEPGSVGVGGPAEPVAWDFDQGPVDGFSYYLRAFDFVWDQPVAELGWGQWTKPSEPVGGMPVCGDHPHTYTCFGFDESDPDFAGCGATDAATLATCAIDCCGEEDRCGIRASIEGGMGYWMYTLDTPHVKWNMPASTVMNYESFGGTFLHDRPQPCINLGGAVRIANRLVVPNDFLHFEPNETGRVDGFAGYMLARTPIGRRGPTDDTNAWTIVVDTGNFSGPVMYMASWFWELRQGWHPDSITWGDRPASIGSVTQGFEGGIGSFEVIDASGVRWMRISRWALPQDTDEPFESTLFFGHSKYPDGWADRAIEPLLAGSTAMAERTPTAIRQSATANRVQPECVTNVDGILVGKDLEDGREFELFELGASSPGGEPTGTDIAQGCRATMTLDPARLDCASSPGWCQGTPYLRLDPDGAGLSAVAEDDVPPAVVNALSAQAFDSSRQNDGRFLGPPAETERACFERPGPASADSRMYCTRTSDGVWIGFRWYRFVDQPELNQAFASLPPGEREAAKCFMQARIERLHEAQQSADQASWFEAPGNLPAPLVNIDPALLVEPPAGLDVGYVPIPVMERYRQQPSECEVIVGPFSEEPDPLPSDYYEGRAFDGYGYETRTCLPSGQSGGQPFDYLATVYPARVAAGDTPVAYAVPRLDAVAATLPASPSACGLVSDPSTP
ncbi:MAG: hypothetical protein AAF411_04020 [Myxococcota bacterium]